MFNKKINLISVLVLTQAFSLTLAFLDLNEVVRYGSGNTGEKFSNPDYAECM